MQENAIIRPDFLRIFNDRQGSQNQQEQKKNTGHRKQKKSKGTPETEKEQGSPETKGPQGSKVPAASSLLLFRVLRGLFKPACDIIVNEC